MVHLVAGHHDSVRQDHRDRVAHLEVGRPEVVRLRQVGPVADRELVVRPVPVARDLAREDREAARLGDQFRVCRRDHADLQEVGDDHRLRRHVAVAVAVEEEAVGAA